MPKKIKPYWLWDNDLKEDEFLQILSGRETVGRRDRTWAAVRLLEYAPYEDILRFIGLKAIVKHWPEWRARVRSTSRKRGIDFLVDYLARHPEKQYAWL